MANAPRYPRAHGRPAWWSTWAVPGLAALVQLYEYVAGCAQPVARDDAARAFGIGRSLAAYHLDKLVGLGLLTASYARPGGDVGSREFIAFWLGDGRRVLAGMNVNIWDVNDAIQALVRSGKPISAQALGDTATPLESLA